MGSRGRTAFVRASLFTGEPPVTGLDYTRLLLPADHQEAPGYDLIILSDLLHFHSSHDALLASVQALLSKSKHSRIHVSVRKPSYLIISIT
jgi:hypothetical protein